nr:MAG TPA: helix-turn-helix domain protein [Caudoviricetes sp.]
MNTCETINDRFKQVRLLLHMSQEEFGKAIGLSKSGVSNIEKGERGLRDTYISAICTQFNIDSRWLRTGNGEPLLADSVTAYENFENYLKSIGYIVNIYTSQDGENSLIEVSKDGKTVTFTESEFSNFQQEISNSVDYQVWKKQNKK